jgi:molybdate transport system substrate-binding protein
MTPSAGAIALIATVSSLPAAAEELRVVSVGTVLGVMKTLAPLYEKASGDTLKTSFGNPGVTIERLRKGEPADVVIYAPVLVEPLAKEGRIDPAGAVDLAKGLLGMAVAAKAPAPAFATKADFVAAMRAVKTIGLADPKGGSGTSPLVLKVFEELGLSAELAPKLRLFQGTGEQVAEAIEHGEAECGFTMVSEFAPVAGVRVVGPIPAEVLPYVSVTRAAVATGAARPEAAGKFIAFLRSEEAKAVFRQAGMDPD